MKPVVHARLLRPGEKPEPALEALTAATGWLARMTPGALVLLKPNFVAPFPIATTDLAFLDFFIKVVRKAGGTPVVGEMSGYEFDTETTLRILGVRPFLEESGVEFVNFEQAEYVSLNLGKGLPTVRVAEVALRADLIINLPVLKAHTITKVTGATKNFFGLLDRDSRRRLHCRCLEKGIAALARSFSNVLHVVDARSLLTRAVFGESKPLNYCLAGEDSFSLDVFGCHLLGVDPAVVGHLPHRCAYKLDGPAPENVTLGDKSSLKERVHRIMYSCFYLLDECKCRMIGGTSLIPHLHWTLGVHPDVSAVSAQALPDVARLCPVDAISVAQHKVLKERCYKVRCLRCYTQDPTGLVVLKGLNPPSKRK